MDKEQDRDRYRELERRMELEYIKLKEVQLISAGHEISQPSSLAVCPCCDRSGPNIEIKNYRINTAYADDELNWQESCKDCYNDTVAYYSDLWDEYYNSQFPI